MSLQIVNEIIGQYQIAKGITKNDLERLANNPRTKTIQFVDPLDNTEIDLLERIVFSKRPDITLRIYGHTCDLTKYIDNIPSLRNISADCLMDAKGIESVIRLRNLETLGVGIFNLDNFDFLNDINPNIKALYLHQTRSKKPKIECINRFTDLEYLYLEGQQKGCESINQLKKLKKVILRSISTPNLDYLQGLKELWSVDIKLGGIKNFDALKTLPNLKYLELWQVRGLGDLSFISDLMSLQNLCIRSLKQVQKLPVLENSSALRRIYLENLKGLKDLSSVKSAPALEEFIYVLAQNQVPEKLIPILGNSKLKSIFCRFGSIKKNDAFDAVALKYGKQIYKYNEFKYK
ncbi:hypothetical protein AAG747_22990 [Rapidithrix thailandica]|uniref:Uncharacterized protein n=1 Tax=Rapidithrix thailandica TaxID=413964 RepID=A0AAW9SJC4_9BACT